MGNSASKTVYIEDVVAFLSRSPLLVYMHEYEIREFAKCFVSKKIENVS
tara:strand:- start:77 stop:223 length:147 start_codon:yes stop_codon:yes gene_type:complete